MGLDPKSVNPAEIRADYEAMQVQPYLRKHISQLITKLDLFSRIWQMWHSTLGTTSRRINSKNRSIINPIIPFSHRNTTSE